MNLHQIDEISKRLKASRELLSDSMAEPTPEVQKLIFEHRDTVNTVIAALEIELESLEQQKESYGNSSSLRKKIRKIHQRRDICIELL